MKYKEYVSKLLAESQELQLPSDEELEIMYPELQHRGQRAHQWHLDQQAKIHRSKRELESEAEGIPIMRQQEQKELVAKVADMIAVCYQKRDESFIDELITLMEKYPELQRDTDLRTEKTITDREGNVRPAKVVGTSKDILGTDSEFKL